MRPRSALARSVLAGAADAGAAEGGRLPGGRSRDRRARYDRDPRSRPSGRARDPARVRRRRGGAVGQPLRPCLADHGGACAERPRGPHRPDRRRRPGRGRRRIHHRRLLRRTDAAAPRRRCRATRSSACSAARWCSRPPMPRATARSRWRRACWPRITRRARACGSMPTSVEAGEALLAFGADAVPGADAAAAVHEFVRRAAISMKPPPIFSAIFARSMRQRARDHRGDAGPERRTGRSHQRPAAPRRGRTGLTGTHEANEYRPIHISAAAAARADREIPRDRRRQICGDRSGRHRALRHRGARPVPRPLAAGAAAGLDRGSLRDLQARRPSTGSRWCRRAATPASSAARRRTTARS